MATSKIQNIKYKVKLNEWALQVKEQQESGISATAWCKLKGIKPTTYFSRLRKVREAALINDKIASSDILLPLKTPVFSKIDINKMNDSKNISSIYDNSSNMIVNLNGASIEIPANAPLETITNILNVVKNL